MGDRIVELQENAFKKANSSEIVSCANDEEFYFIAGQVARYMVSQSEAKNKLHSFLDPFIIAKNAKVLKQKLVTVYSTYNHAIGLNHPKFNNLYGMVMGYESDSKMSDYIDIFLAGVCSRNIIFIKKEENKDGNDE